MHGIIFLEMKKYVQEKLGDKAWAQLLNAAGLSSKAYLPTAEYPDQDAVALVTTAAAITKQPAAAILEDFGAFIVPDLVSMYMPLIRPEWKTLDVLEHTENTMHRAVRINSPGAKPPELKSSRVSKGEVVILYSSARRMCDLAKGIIKGVAKHYNEKVQIAESSCMHRGDPHCRITVKVSA